MRYIPVAAFLFAVFFLAVAPSAPADAVGGDQQLRALQRINLFRALHGLGPLAMEERLAMASQHHAEDMARNGFFSDNGSDGSSLEIRVRRAGYSYRQVAEQLALGYPGFDSVVDMWMQRAASRRTLLSPNLVEAGIGYASTNLIIEGKRFDHFWVLILGEPTRIAAGDWQREVLERVNNFRSQYGLRSLGLDPRLSQAAQAHADDMAFADYFDHVAPDGSSAGERAQRFGYPWRRIHENIAAGQATPREVVEGWIKSSSHRSAMLDSRVEEAGIGHIYLPEDDGHVRHHHYWALSLGQR
jgi:uncharacterized protein YkwD